MSVLYFCSTCSSTVRYDKVFFLRQSARYVELLGEASERREAWGKSARQCPDVAYGYQRRPSGDYLWADIGKGEERWWDTFFKTMDRRRSTVCTAVDHPDAPDAPVPVRYLVRDLRIVVQILNSRSNPGIMCFVHHGDCTAPTLQYELDNSTDHTE